MDKNKALQSIVSPAAEGGMEGNQPQTTTLGWRKRERTRCPLRVSSNPNYSMNSLLMPRTASL